MTDPNDPASQFRDIDRLGEILGVLGRHGFGQALSALPRIPGLRATRPAAGTSDLPAPRRLVQAMEELGPTFIKLGQMLSTRSDLLSDEFVTAFARLQDEVPPFPGAEAIAVIEAELGASVADLFEQLDPEPIASASMAQVHRGRLRDGRLVAVKVQRPGIERTLRADVNILYALTELLEGQLDLGIYRPQQIVRAFDRAVALECDFLNEASHAELFAEAVASVPGVVVPKVHRQLSSRRVLTLDWVDGVKLSRIHETDVDPGAIMDRLVAATYEQLFVRSIFHADPHPGNLVVTPEGDLAYLDFGLMGRVTPEMRDTLEQLFVGVIFRDAEGLARTLYRAGAAEGRVELRKLSAQVEELLERYGGTRLAEQDTSAIALELMALAREHRLALPEEFAVLARAQVTLDGISRELVPGWNIEEAVKPYAARLARERLDPDRVGGDALRSAVAAATLLRDLPGQLDQLLLDLERGQFQLTAETPAVDRLTATLDRLARSVVFSIGISAFLLSASILVGVLVSSAEPDGFGLFDLTLAFGVVASLLAATSLVTALLWSLFVQERLRAMPWRRLARLLPFPRRRRPPTGGSEQAD